MDISPAGPFTPVNRSDFVERDGKQDGVTQGRGDSHASSVPRADASRLLPPVPATGRSGEVSPDASNLIVGSRGQHVDTRI